MKKAAVLCADIGTSSIKLSLIDFDGTQRCFVREAFPFDRVSAGTVEAEDWKKAFRDGIASLRSEALLEKNCRDADITTEVKAIAISGNGPTLVPVTHAGKALQPLYWHDKHLYVPPHLQHKTSSFFLPRAAWLRHHAEHQYNDVNIFLSTQEWLSYQLGADPVTVLPSPSYIPFYWDDDQLNAFNLDAAKFAPFAEMGTMIGRVSSQAASYFDLPPNIPIIAGGPDFIMALIGTGTIQSGMVCDRAGTSEGINVCTDSPLCKKFPAQELQSQNLRTLPHVKDGLWNVSAMIPQSGKIFEWYRDMTGQNNRPYREMMNEIIGDIGFDCQPLDADFLSASHSGVGFIGEGDSGRTQLGRAIVESIGFMVLDSLQTLQSYGFSVTEMRVSGGQAKNPMWNQLKANICGCTLHVPEIIDAELAGNACMAMIHLGEAGNIDEACRKIVKIKETFTPDPLCHKHYLKQFASYDGFIESMTWHHMLAY
jgi:xylulokinase